MNAMAHASEIIHLLEKEYPDAKIALDYKTPWQLLVAVVLSAQCTDVLVNEVTPALFQKYPTVRDVAHANPTEFAHDIARIGFYHAKAKNIVATAKMIETLYKGSVPNTMEALLTLPGIGRKSANVILGNAFGTVVGIAVDTHVLRISQRLRLVNLESIGGKDKRTFVKNGTTIVDFKKDADPNKIEQELMRVIPKSDWFRVTYLIQFHGRAVCKALRPDCARCVIRHLCPASRV